MKRMLFLVLLSFSLISFATTQENKTEYDSVIDQINDMVQANKASCPGVGLVITCGNMMCESHKGETLKTCPADCKPNVTVRAYNNITLCDEYVKEYIPSTVKDIQKIIKRAAKEKLTVKPIGTSHSATEIMCGKGIAVAMERFNKVIGLSTVNGQQVVETEVGVTMWEVSEWLHANGLALAGQPHMGFRDVSIGGAIATGSHGSTVKHSGVISNIVEAIEFVDGLGKVHYMERHSANPDEFKALSASLGLLGIVTKVKLGVQKQFNLAVKISYHREKEIFNNGLINTVKDCDYGQLNWFPGVKKYVKTCGKRTTKRAHRKANNSLLNPTLPKFIVNPFKTVLQLGTCSNGLMGLIERFRWWQFKYQPPLKRQIRRKVKHTSFAIGPSHRMVSSHLTGYQEGLFQMDWEIAVPASKAQAAMVAIKDHVRKNKTKLPLVGAFIRFAPAESKTLLAHTLADGEDWKEGEPVVLFEMPVFVPIGFSDERFKAYEKQFKEFAAMLITDFSARPHWGKNRAWTFDLVLKHGGYKQLEKFKKVVKKFDPNGIFKNKFAKRLGL